MDAKQKQEARRCLEQVRQKIQQSDKTSNIGCIAFGGSVAYGLDTPSSDIDIRGFALPSAKDILLMKDFENISFSDIDAVLYSLKKTTSLLLACNPNVIEILGVKDEHVLETSDVFETMRKARDIFISQKAASTFGGYAKAQLIRIKNAVYGYDPASAAEHALSRALDAFDDRFDAYANGDIEVYVKDDDVLLDIDVKGFPAAQMKGAFSDLSAVLNSIGKPGARNTKRDASKISKHASHLLRLLHMGSDLLEGKGICTYRKDDADLLLDVKRGIWTIEDENGKIAGLDDAFWDAVDEAEKRFSYAKQNTSLPEKPDFDAAWEIVVDAHAEIVGKRD